MWASGQWRGGGCRGGGGGIYVKERGFCIRSIWRLPVTAGHKFCSHKCTLGLNLISEILCEMSVLILPEEQDQRCCTCR